MSAARGVKQSALQAWEQEVSGASTTPVNGQCIGVAEAMAPEETLQVVIELGFKHVCQKSGHDFAKEMNVARLMIEQNESFFSFPIAGVLDPSNLTAANESRLLHIDFKFTSSLEKPRLMNLIEELKTKLNISQTTYDDIVSVSDELFTNAAFNAPLVDVTTQRNGDAPRYNQEVKMAEGHFGRFYIAEADGRLLIGCLDTYGSLDLPRYFNKINATYMRGPAATMNFGRGGAGIGSYLIFNASASLYAAVWTGRYTIMSCVIPLGLSNRKRSQLAKHLHWIQR